MRSCWSKRRRGLALPEILICMVVASLMLTATAVAFNASIHSYRDNQERNQLLSHGRIVLGQIVYDIRHGDAHYPINDAAVPNADSLFLAGTVTENSGLRVEYRTPSVEYPAIVASDSGTWVRVRYEYNPAEKTIEMTRKIGTRPAVKTIAARYVQDFRVRMEPARSAVNVYSGDPTYDLLLRGVVTITLANVDANGKIINDQGNRAVTIRLTDAAMPRKAFAGV